MTAKHITAPLPRGISITNARRIAVETETAIARVTGTMVEATVTDLHLTDRERNVVCHLIDVAVLAMGQRLDGIEYAELTAGEREAVNDLRARICPHTVVSETMREVLDA